MLSASYTSERDKFARFSVPYRNEVVAILVKKKDSGHYPLQSLKDIMDNGIKIAVERDGWYGDEFDELKENPDFASHLVISVGLEQRIKMLMLGRVEMIIDDMYALTGMAERLGVRDSVEFHSYFLVQDSVHFMFSRKSVSEESVKEFNKALLRLKKSGEIQETIDEYLK